jgi:hypothetical protein
MPETALQLTGSLHKIEKKADGNIRLTFDFGLDSFEAIQELERFKYFADNFFAFAIVPYKGRKPAKETIPEQLPSQDLPDEPA